MSTQTPSPDLMRRMADAIRFLAMDAIERAGEGHPGTPLGAADTATALFTRHVKFNPLDPRWPDRDRFVQSNGHGSMLIYSLLHLTGYPGMTLDQLKSFRVLGSHCAGHPEIDQDLGIEVTTGVLGQGIANAAGMALAEALLNARFGDAIVDHYTYAMVGDGCLQEGVGQEVISLAGHLRLGKLIVLWDDNQMTDDGDTRLALSDDIPGRFRVSNWHVQEVDGHDPEQVSAALSLAKTDLRPSLIACRTRIGEGIPRVQGQRAAHGGRVFADDTQAARTALNWPHGPFEVPDDLRNAWLDAGRRSQGEYDAWVARVEAMAPEDRAEFERLRAGHLPESWTRVIEDHKRTYLSDPPTDFAYKTSGELIEALAGAIPELLSGAPDLEGATLHKRSLEAFTATNRSGRYVHYGIREHVMGAMLNGIAAHGGVIPCGITYLVFSDYERPAIRMAALMKLPVKFIFSHDSIGIGTNGPTHQPVEFFASLRAIPRLYVFRPADAVELAECWELTVERRDGPCALAFPRMALTPVREAHEEENLCRRGAYVLKEAEGGPRKVTLLATGSEVAVALKARSILQAEGTPTAVVSMPCLELFEQQDKAYRDSVVNQSTVRVAVEAAIRQGWDYYVGENGGFVGMDDFGASGPPEALFEHFGITPNHVAAEARSRLKVSLNRPGIVGDSIA
ncbi:MAG: transketolase [Rhodospirillum sp.]|nr:transketolase [Rhodospirillum sp.]MCF8489731.1 transketolase [Rhodospirillum sp.]